MAEKDALTPHELLELHELLQSEITALKKLQAGLEDVEDTQFKALLQSTVDAKRGRVSALYQFASSLQGMGGGLPAAGQGHGKHLQ